ncbi:meiotic recombination protein W68 [Musca domestica]|uniref:DNA topoisomerase (ATP-hydrolyzing) n=1 Tax=Musca domestica TaxID=7370 RepID=A0A9J7D7X2_MUSDO|nr:meiotic recombination protein W68 [Musca domestica]
MINNIEVLINSWLRDLILWGPNMEIYITRNDMLTMTGAAAVGSGIVNLLGATGDNICLSNFNTDVFTMVEGRQAAAPSTSVMERLVYGNRSNRKRMAILLYVMAEIHDLLLRHSSCTYRELYYRNIYLPCNVWQINKAVEDVASVLGQTPWNMGVFGTGKGMIAGPLFIHMNNGDIIECNKTNTPTMIPPQFTHIDHFETTAHLVLVVEKDTIFKKLIANNIFSIMQGKLILLTARGNPDLSTRWLLSKLVNEHNLPIYMLADADPYGIEIMLTYRFGSKKYSQYAHQLATPQLKWLGIHPSDITYNLQIPQEILSEMDYRKINSVMRRNYIPEEICRELMVLQQHGFKAKLDNMSGQNFALFINDYIINKIKRQVVL